MTVADLDGRQGTDTEQTVQEVITAGMTELATAGVASPRYDAEQLAAHSLGCQRSELWRHLADPAPVGLTGLLTRRAAREPLQHITGWAYFRHLTVSVGPGVFIPRPETEVVVEAALRLLADNDEAPIVVDLCAGSGAIALAIATERVNSQVHAVETSSDALPWLRANVADADVVIHAADIAEPLPGLEGRVDLVIANPPYIPEDAVPRDREVADFDPAVALFSGPDGLDHIRLVERAAARLLKPGGFVVVEHADVQGITAPSVFRNDLGWIEVTDHRDLTGRDRFLTAQRRATAGTDRAAL